MSAEAGPIDQERLGELFERALELPPDAHEQFLDEHCGAELGLRLELLSLLAAHARGPGHLERMAESSLPAAIDALTQSSSPAGQIVGHYEILKVIGSGGMGLVYKARDLALGRPAALKFLHSHAAIDAAARLRFESEARAASALDHPNIAVVYEVGVAGPLAGPDHGDRLFIAMAYYEGETIREKIDRGPLPVAEALGYALQIADGLASAHEAGIVHRDIKPANVIVTRRGEAKILDFGIAKSDGAECTVGQATPGTVAYMSPEQTLGQRVDHRADVWSLGVLLYEMLAGRRPFAGDDDAVVINAIRHDAPEPLLRLRPETPASLPTIVDVCLQKDPSARFQRMTELLDALRAVLNCEAVDLHRPRHRTGLRLGVGVIGLAAIIAVAVLAIEMQQDSRPVPDAAVPGHSPLPRLAVLPLANLSADVATNYLGYALADEITSRVGKLEGLVLRPSSAARKYHGTTFDPRQVGEALAVDHVLTGSYLKDGDTLRVHIQFIDVASGRVEPQEPLRVPYEGVFRLQELVTQQVIRQLGLDVSAQGRQRIERDVVTDPAAYHLYLRALENPHSTEDGVRYAYELLHRSIELDPTFAPALAALACRAFGLANLGFNTGAARHEAWREAEQRFEEALTINPDQMHALTCQALLYAESGRIEAAIEPLRHALAIQPNSADVYISLGHVYRKGGLLEAAARVFEHARALDPTNLRLPPAGLAYLYLGRYEAALEWFALDPISPPSLAWQGMVFFHMGRMADARERFERVSLSGTGGPFGLGADAYLAYMENDRERGLAAVRALEDYASRGGNIGEELYHFATLNILFGEHSTGILLLEQALERGFFPYPFLLVDPFLDPVRGHARVQHAILQARDRHEAFRTLAVAAQLPL